MLILITALIGLAGTEVILWLFVFCMDRRPLWFIS